MPISERGTVHLYNAGIVIHYKIDQKFKFNSKFASCAISEKIQMKEI